MLARSRAWLAATPDARAVLAAVDADPLAAAVPLRWLAGLHHLALLQRAPWAALWPPSPGPSDDGALDAAIEAAWSGQRPHLAAALARPPQTNEVQRGAALLPGLLHIAAACGRPLVLAEIGASAGLNLWCDRYRHEHDGWSWGRAESALTLRGDWAGPPPWHTPEPPPLMVVERAGCDRHPVDLARPGEALRLASFVWADQRERLDRLHAACALASAEMAAGALRIEPARAADFLRAQLACRLPGTAFVLMHSVVWQYIEAQEQADIRAQMAAAARQATEAAPLAWLRFEPPQADQPVELRCSVWPGGEDRLLARCHPHASRITWLAGEPA